MNKEQKVTNNIKASNKDLEVLKKHFSHCFDKHGAFDFEKFRLELSKNEVNFSKESYGLDWLGKSYARLIATDEATTLLKDDEEFNQKEENKNSQNLLIKGDNIEVLKHLSNAYYEKIKMIYIDPPYNTGSDGFVYHDNRKFSVSEFIELTGVDEERAKRILSFVDSKSNSHSAWLTFIYPRLYIAKQLLKDDGVIFVSIDDNEVAQLRLLMDEIFGEENFVGNFIWEKVKIRKNSALYFTENHDYILVYAKNKKQDINDKGWERQLLEREKHNYKNPDNDPNGPWIKGSLIANHHYSADYKIKKPNGVVLSKPKNASWRYSWESIQKFIEEDRIIWGKDDSYPMVKKYLKDAKNGLVPKTILNFAEFGGNPDGANELKNLFDGFKVFENPKPTKLIKKLIQIANINNNDLILDFFAGSGTTADALMQLNSEDGGERKFILVQLPEPIDPKKNKTAYEFLKNELKVEEPTIFEITKERLIRASKKIKEEISKDLTKDLSNLDLGFKIFETMPIWEDYDFEADEFDATLELFDESRLTKDDIKALLITWKTYDGVALTKSLKEVDLGGYTAFYVSEKLYLINKGFKTDNLKTLLEKIDQDKEFNPTSIIAFGYHFESKNLREIAENIKSFSNKKSMDIDFITRY